MNVAFTKPFIGLKLSPITRRRLANFRANKRGFYALWVFIALLLITLPAEFVANDRPLVVYYDHHLYFPALVDYPESTFGGFLAVTDYRSPFIRDQFKKPNWAIWPLIEYNYRTINRDPSSPAPSPPSKENWLGTDNQSRDVLARVIYGFRVSVLFGLILTIISSAIGVAAGAIQGYFGGWIDLTFQRFIEIWRGLPQLYVLIIIASVIQPSFWSLVGILLLFQWMALTQLVRAEFLRARNFDYIRAARAMGINNLTIMWRHVLPNAMVATLTFLPFVLTGSVTALTTLDFLGFGLPPGSASLGELLNQGRSNPQAPWLGLTGFAVLATMLTLMIFIGEAVRDAFDPKKTGL
ncbi:MAG TPA: ABC transporter permease [Alphaproteobacteria bacterium]|nr:ABC transporter permease [Alphaproteobacteria bacterium]